MYRKATLRKMQPQQRKIAETVNDMEKVTRRLKKVVELLGPVEEDAASVLLDRQMLDRWAAKQYERTTDEEALFDEGQQRWIPIEEDWALSGVQEHMQEKRLW